MEEFLFVYQMEVYLVEKMHHKDDRNNRADNGSDYFQNVLIHKAGYNNNSVADSAAPNNACCGHACTCYGRVAQIYWLKKVKML